MLTDLSFPTVHSPARDLGRTVPPPHFAWERRWAFPKSQREHSDRESPISSRASEAENADGSAFDYRPTILGYLKARLFRPEDAEDLTQEVFVRYWRQACVGSIPAERPFPWLLGIARNVLREHLRTVGRRREVSWSEAVGESTPSRQTEDVSPVDLSIALREAMASLTAIQRRVIHRRYHEGQSVRQVAAELGRSEGAVKLLLFRARRVLRGSLTRQLRDRQFRESQRPG